MFNAVVENNVHARHLYKRLGFVQTGTVPNGFLMRDGTYQNICLYYHELWSCLCRSHANPCPESKSGQGFVYWGRDARLY